MCGIVGIAADRGIAPSDHAWLYNAMRIQKHRGPDASGFQESADRRCLFGHQRLAVIDTSSRSSQPMATDAGVMIVFNGEIYNFRELREVLFRLGHSFQSTGDTEVILRGYLEWGVDVFARLVGAFAIAIYDVREGRLVLARDRAGEKPLYFHEGNHGELSFASELKAILCRQGQSWSIDLQSLDSYLHVGYGLAQQSMVSGIRKLSAGHYLVWDIKSGSGTTQEYWAPLRYVEPSSVNDPGDLSEELDTLLMSSVKSQLVADVPLGILLSGGTDSSLITAYAAEFLSSVRTFTIRFPGYAQLDESTYARQVARHFGTDHTEMDASELQPEILDGISKSLDDPIADSSLIPTYVVSQLVREKCTVALGGDGGDELFGGYLHYTRLAKMAQLSQRFPAVLRRWASATTARWMPHGMRGRNWVQAFGYDLRSQVPLLGVMFDVRARNSLVPALRELPHRSEMMRAEVPNASTDIVDRATRLDFSAYLVEDILVKTDRMSMMNSLELRAPFLDRDVMDFAFSLLPPKFKANESEGKVLLRRVAKRRLPDSLDVNRKQGFSIPLGEWLRMSQSWREFFYATLLDDADDFLDRKEVERLWVGHERGRQNSERLFALVVLKLWMSNFGIKAVDPA